MEIENKDRPAKAFCLIPLRRFYEGQLKYNSVYNAINAILALQVLGLISSVMWAFDHTNADDLLSAMGMLLTIALSIVKTIVMTFTDNIYIESFVYNICAVRCSVVQCCAMLCSAVQGCAGLCSAEGLCYAVLSTAIAVGIIYIYIYIYSYIYV